MDEFNLVPYAIYILYNSLINLVKVEYIAYFILNKVKLLLTVGNV